MRGEGESRVRRMHVYACEVEMVCKPRVEKRKQYVYGYKISQDYFAHSVWYFR